MSHLNFSRRHFLKISGLGLATASLQQTACGSSRQPNILLIMTDDQGWGDVSSHGNLLLKTPNMDRIAAEGARFDRFYVSPVCAPTRSSLLTGRYHMRTGVHGVTRGRENMRAEEVTLAEILKSNGYATGCFGKWHNGAHYPYHPNGQGFEEFFGFCSGHWNNYFDTTLDHNGKAEKTKGYINDVITDEALSFIDSKKDQPFFCYVPYNTPHSPFQVPDEAYKKHKAKGLSNKLACVYAMCENLDMNIGRMLDKLDELKLSKDTIVLFFTDNGPNGSRFNGGMKGTKGWIHEGGVRVPGFVRWPKKIEAGLTIKPISAHIDMLPTLLTLCGLPIPADLDLDGFDVSALLLGGEKTWNDRQIVSYWGGRGSIRTQQYRLAVYPNRLELYDMIEDPSELNNIKDKKPDITAKLKKAYDQWYADVTSRGFDPVPIPVGYKEWPNVTMPGHEAFLEQVRDKGISYYDTHGWANDWVANWTNKKAYPWWEIDVVEEGEFEIALEYVCPKKDVGAKFEIRAAGETIQGQVTKAYDPPLVHSPDKVKRKEVYEKTWKTLPVGKMKLTKGRTKLSIHALSKPGKTVMDVKSVLIKRIS